MGQISEVWFTFFKQGLKKGTILQDKHFNDKFIKVNGDASYEKKLFKKKVTNIATETGSLLNKSKRFIHEKANSLKDLFDDVIIYNFV